MNKLTFRAIVATVILALVVLPFLIKKRTANEQAYVQPDSAFSAYVAAFTSGIISNESSIRIELMDEVKGIKPGEDAGEDYFRFQPSIEGHAVWLNNRTIEFKPDARMPSNQDYRAEFFLSKIIKDIPANFKTFEFSFKTIPQWFDVSIDEIKTTDKKTLRWQRVKGSLTMADGISEDLVAQFVTATQNDKKLKINWTAEGANHIYDFIIDSISRTEKPSNVIIKWDGSPANLAVKGEKIIEVPSISDFKILDVTLEQGSDQAVAIQFSDPVDERQNLQGLISIDGQGGTNSLKFVATDNMIKVYPESRITGAKTIHIQAGVKNCLGYALKSDFNLELLFEELKPEIKLTANGVILPTSKELSFPFKAVSLKMVDVKVVKIYENNITQFFQSNSLEGENELRRVGKTVYKGTVSLLPQLGKNEIGKWNNFSLDLSKLVKSESGAIYRITISFKKEYSAYSCDGVVVEQDIRVNQFNDEDENEDDDGWDYNRYYYDYEEYDYGEYDYSQRDNPCHPMYYRYTAQSQNILASDIGLIAKKTNGGKLVCVANDILTTNPLANIEIELYNYQQQVVESQRTNEDGICTFTIKDKPFVIIAKKGSQRGYLKLNDGASLSLSMFDVSGEAIQKGLKGFIYGERGVWRPGDSIYLSFILQDKLKTLPKDHPVLFELYNPLRQLYKKMSRTASLDGFYNFSTVTDANAPTGNWLARIKVGGVMFEKQIKVETVMPNRLKINMDFGSGKTLLSDQSTGNLSAKWLTGVPARNLNAKVELLLDKSQTTFKKFEEYNFDDPLVQFSSEMQTVFESPLNNEGLASFKPNIQISGNAPGLLTAYFVVRVFEEGGNASIDRFNMPYYPYKTYAGIKIPKSKDNWSRTLAADTTHIVKLANVDVEGNPVSGNLKVQVYRVEWRWWWQSSSGDMANYLGDNYHQPVLTQTVSAKGGNGQFNLKIKKQNWGRYFIRVTDLASGHTTGETVYIDYWSGTNDGLVRQGNEGVSMLSFTSDKTKYNVGEEMTLTIPSGSEGRALISLENSSKIISTKWIETVKGQNTVKLKITEEMTPNIFVAVHFLQPHSQSMNDLPIRLYGILPILVENPETRLNPVLNCPAEWRPEEKASFSVYEKDGKEMIYNVAIVDEGLLDLTRFKTPDPWNHFYSREALGVKTWDLYDKVIGAYSGELQKLLSIGGDGSVNQKVGDKANRFKPMVKYFGPFKLKKGEKVTHEFMMPQYVGSVRAMIIAEEGNAFGSSEKTVPVRKPLMVLGTLPRVVAPGETVTLPVTVFALAKHIKNVNISVSANDIFSIEESKTKALNFTDIGDEVVNFKLKVNSKIGVGKVNIIATCGNEKARYDIEIQSRNPNSKMTKVIEAVIEPGKSWTQTVSTIGVAGTNKGTLELSKMPPINLGNRLSYLITYPHGCIEQTSSSVFPQLFLNEITELSSNRKVEIDLNIKNGIERLRMFQTVSGGFGYWPGNSEPDNWGTSYAGHFLLEADAKGYAVPPGMMENWKRFQKQKALNWSPNRFGDYYYDSDYLSQAYRLYTLALAKAPELGAMNRMKEMKNLPVAAKWRLAAAYALAGLNEAAQSIVLNAPTSVKNYTELYYTYGSSERDQAMVLETMAIMGDRNKAFTLAKEVAKNLGSDSWYSTQTTAYSLIAISKYIKLVGNSSQYITCKYSLNSAAAQSINSALTLKQFDLEMKGAADRKTVSVTNTGNGALFVRVILEGVPETDNVPASMNNLNMGVRFLSMEGAEIDVTKLEQGTDFVAQVTLYNPGTRGDYKQMALSQVFPSGWEIRNGRMDEKNSDTKSSIPDYQDIRDDRVYTYFDVYHGTSKTFNILLNASYTGKFYMPAVYCEAMYDNTISAKSEAKWVEVVKPASP